MLRFNEIIYGPVHSRRLGLSLGVNLLPVDAKICSFNCIYCECGFNTTMREFRMPRPAEVQTALAETLQAMTQEGQLPDVITFAGNGEPTLHPDFEEIIDNTIAVRDLYCPSAKISVLSNSTKIHLPKVLSALQKVDNNIMKFDSATERTMRLMDCPVSKQVTVKWLINNLKKFAGKLIIQTMFLRGETRGEKIDNTTKEEVAAWLAALHEIRPLQVMIYSIDRETPVSSIQKISIDELNAIAEQARSQGFDVMAV
ncbi:MAG: radical SAM protein [Paludibacter sp.]|jgi:wyosine [tRNA(Phe)-imidazoG37] synthetase (radical SAM superfamily)|nr:radical SAM protein [Paludibacter sp.]